MRKCILAAALAALGAAVVASPAFAFDRHFSVLAKVKSGHQVGPNKFRIKEKLLDPDNRRNKVGRDRITCREKPRKLKCHGVFRLNGKIGGKGHIRFRGDLGQGEKHMVVLGGSRQFDGVAGKVIAHNTTKPGLSSRYHFDLVR